MEKILIGVRCRVKVEEGVEEAWRCFSDVKEAAVKAVGRTVRGGRKGQQGG